MPDVVFTSASFHHVSPYSTPSWGIINDSIMLTLNQSKIGPLFPSFALKPLFPKYSEIKFPVLAK
jgi:hypothetical protein